MVGSQPPPQKSLAALVNRHGWRGEPGGPLCAAHKAPPHLDPRSALFVDGDNTLQEIVLRPELVRVLPALPATAEVAH